MAARIDHRFLALVVPPAIWAAAFVMVYASESVICSRLDSTIAHAALVATLGLAALAGLALMAIHAARGLGPGAQDDARFYRGAGLASALVSLIATIWTLAPAVMLTACAG